MWKRQFKEFHLHRCQSHSSSRAKHNLIEGAKIYVHRPQKHQTLETKSSVRFYIVISGSEILTLGVKRREKVGRNKSLTSPVSTAYLWLSLLNVYGLIIIFLKRKLHSKSECLHTDFAPLLVSGLSHQKRPQPQDRNSLVLSSLQLLPNCTEYNVYFPQKTPAAYCIRPSSIKYRHFAGTYN